MQRVGALLTVFFHPGPVRNFDDAAACNTSGFAAFHRHLLECGVYLPPSQFEALFVSTVHGDDEIDRPLPPRRASSRGDRFLWGTIAAEAAAESPLWEAALLPRGSREEEAVFSRARKRALRARARVDLRGLPPALRSPAAASVPSSPTRACCSATISTLTGSCAWQTHGNVEAVADLAELISLCTQLRAEGDGAGGGRLDGAAWAATATLLGAGDGGLEESRAALRRDRDPAPLEVLATEVAGSTAVARALEAHVARVG